MNVFSFKADDRRHLNDVGFMRYQESTIPVETLILSQVTGGNIPPFFHIGMEISRATFGIQV